MAFPLFDLSGRRALVTGSTQGIGLALAEGLAAHGAEVVLNGRDPAKLDAAAERLVGVGYRVGHAPFDVTDAEAVAAGVAAVEAKGRAAKGDKTLLDVLIPVAQAVESLVAEGRTEQLGGRMVAAAAHGLHATTHMVARHGLAADLGPASVNRLDPGACSCALLVGALVSALEEADSKA